MKHSGYPRIDRDATSSPMADHSHLTVYSEGRRLDPAVIGHVLFARAWFPDAASDIVHRGFGAVRLLRLHQGGQHHLQPAVNTQNAAH